MPLGDHPLDTPPVLSGRQGLKPASCGLLFVYSEYNFSVHPAAQSCVEGNIAQSRLINKFGCNVQITVVRAIKLYVEVVAEIAL